MLRITDLECLLNKKHVFLEMRQDILIEPIHLIQLSTSSLEWVLRGNKPGGIHVSSHGDILQKINNQGTVISSRRIMWEVTGMIK